MLNIRNLKGKMWCYESIQMDFDESAETLSEQTKNQWIYSD